MVKTETGRVTSVRRVYNRRDWWNTFYLLEVTEVVSDRSI